MLAKLSKLSDLKDCLVPHENVEMPPITCDKSQVGCGPLAITRLQKIDSGNG